MLSKSETGKNRGKVRQRREEKKKKKLCSSFLCLLFQSFNSCVNNQCIKQFTKFIKLLRMHLDYVLKVLSILTAGLGRQILQPPGVADTGGQLAFLPWGGGGFRTHLRGRLGGLLILLL